MDKRSLEAFSGEHVRAINETDENIRKWKKFQGDYEALRGRLATLPDKVSYEIMVPFTSLAFMPGRLVHTNELLVLLGDNWFAERSAKEAAEIVDRRLKVVRKTLSDLEKQKAMLASRHEFTKGLQARAASGNEFEIREEYDERKERAWRAEHQRRVASAKKAQPLPDKPRADAVRRKADRSSASGGCADDARAFARLEELGQQERERRELRSLDKSAARSAPAAAAAATADADDDDSAAAAATRAPISRTRGHAKKEGNNAAKTPKKRVTFLDEMQDRQSSELSQPETDASSEGSDTGDTGDSEAEETGEKEEEEDEEENEDEDAGKDQSISEDDGDTRFSADYHQWRPPGSNSHPTIFFTHSKPAEEAVSMGESDDKKRIPTDDGVPAAALSPADVYKLVAGPDLGCPDTLPPPLLPAVALITEAKSSELKSILKQQIGATDGNDGSTLQEPLAAIHSSRMPVKPAPARSVSAPVPAFGDHVIERDASSLPSSGSSAAPASESVRSSGPQRPVSKFKAQQQRLHR